jgi:hypothetical protein
MNELLALFNISNLDDNEIGHLMWVLNSPSYERVFAPYLRGIRDSANRMLLDRSQERKNKFPDDYLAGIITTVDGLLELFTRLVTETDMERIRESQQEQPDEVEYARAQMAGRIKPAGQVVEPEYDPAQDF